jgi:predicted nucleic acid-binding protein
MQTVADTGPIVSAADPRDEAHELAAALVSALGRDLVVPDTVMVEVDYLLRARVGLRPARAFLSTLVAGEHSSAFLTPGLLRRAVEIDARYESLDLGLVDASVMAYADRHDLPVLTFDFDHFRAAPPPGGHWRLVVDEARYIEATA